MRSTDGAGSVPTWSTCGSHLAATTMEATVDSALSLLLEAGQPFDYAEVRDLAEPKVPEAPALTLSGQPDLKIYDRLLTVSLATVGVCG